MEDALRRAQMSVQPLKTSDTLACPGDPAMPTDPEILKVCPPLPSCPPPPVLVRSRATVEACPTPSGKLARRMGAVRNGRDSQGRRMKLSSQ